MYFCANAKLIIMKRILKSLTMLAACVMSAMFVSCSKDNPAGKGKLVINGTEYDFDKVIVDYRDPSVDGIRFIVKDFNVKVLEIEMAQSHLGKTLDLTQLDPYVDDPDVHYKYRIVSEPESEVKLWGGSGGTTLADTGTLYVAKRGAMKFEFKLHYSINGSEVSFEYKGNCEEDPLLTKFVNKTFTLDGEAIDFETVEYHINGAWDGITFSVRDHAENEVMTIGLAESNLGVTLDLSRFDPYYKESVFHNCFRVSTTLSEEVFLSGAMENSALADEGTLLVTSHGNGEYFIDLRYRVNGHTLIFNFVDECKPS